MLTSSYPRYPGDNASVFLQYLNVGLSSKGTNVHVVAPASNTTERLINDGIHIHRFRYLPRPLRMLAYGSGILPNLRKNPLLWIALPFFLISMSINLVRIANQTKADLIHCHWVLPQGLVALLTSPFHKKNYIVTVHGGDAFSLNSRFLRFLKRYVLRHAIAWTANTEITAAAACRPDSSHNARIIPMGVNVSRFSAGNGEILRQRLPHNTRIILYVGRLVEKKGVSVLLNAFSLLLENNEQHSLLWIVGDGLLRKELELEANQLNILDKVRFWGNIENDMLPNMYAAADIFVGPSLVDVAGDSEGQGVVFIEAFASGTPVIASKVGGIPEVVTHLETGILVPPNNPELLSKEISKLIEDPEIGSKLAENAKNEVRRKYDWNNISDEFFDLYSSVK